MKRQHLITLILIVAVVGGLGLYLRKKETQSWDTAGSRVGQKLLKEFPINDVVHIRIQGPTNELNLTKKDEIWTVQEREFYPANFTKVGESVRKLWELKITQPQTASPETLSRFQLLSPGEGTNSATVVELKNKEGKSLIELRLGKKHMRQSSGGFGGDWPDGRYVMVGQDLKSVSLITDALTDLEPQAEQWIDKDFFKVENIQSIAVTTADPAESWTVSRESATGEWALADLPEGKELDKTKTSSFGHLLSSPYFNDLALGQTPEAMGLAEPRQALIRTFDQFTYTLRIGDTNSEGNYFIQAEVNADLPAAREAKPDETPEQKEAAEKAFQEKQKTLKDKLQKEQRIKPWTYIVSKWTVDPLLKSKGELLTDKQAQPEPTTQTPDPAEALFPDPTQPLPTDAPPLPRPIDEPKQDPAPEPAKPDAQPEPPPEPEPTEQPKEDEPGDQNPENQNPDENRS